MKALDCMSNCEYRSEKDTYLIYVANKEYKHIIFGMSPINSFPSIRDEMTSVDPINVGAGQTESPLPSFINFERVHSQNSRPPLGAKTKFKHHPLSLISAWNNRTFSTPATIRDFCPLLLSPKVE